MILVTGAAGKTGQAVLRALIDDGHSARGLVRDRAQAAGITALGAEPIIGDMQDETTLASAMHGASAVYLICPNVHPAELEIGRAAIRAAQNAGVDRFVYHSVLFPQIEAMPHHWFKLRVEEQLIASGLDFAILQPASYMQNMLPYLHAIRERGEYRVPYSTEAVFTPVDLEDVAVAAAQVLTLPVHSHAVYALAGPEALSSTAMAIATGSAMNVQVKAIQQSIPEWQRSASSLSAYAMETLSKMFEYYDKHVFAASSFTLKSLLQRPPTTFKEFLQRELRAK